MATSEIEKLERRYAENPHGLTFAPLAEVHRKNGDIPRALELLRVGLELHPNYIPASIVLGRCHQDLGDLPAAEAAFSHVLRLDDENVIALKSLADINERQDRLDDAERWLRRLVTVDRSNDEAKQQLQHLETLREQARRKAPAGRPSGPVEVPAETTVPAPAAKSPPTAEPPAPAAPEEPAPIPAESLDLAAELEPRRVEPEVLPPSPPARPEEPAPLAGLETSEFQPPKDLPQAPAPLGLELELEEDVVLRSSGASEFTVPDASQDFLALAAQMNASRPRTPGRRASDREAAERRQQPPPPPPTPPAPSAPPESVAPSEPPPAAPSRSYAARDTKGQSIVAFFQTLLMARPPALPAEPDLSAGETEAMAIREEPDGRAPAQDPATISFDDFFGAGTAGSSPAGSPEPGKDDLDQFQSWLQNLKR